MRKKLLSLLLVIAMLFTTVLGLTGCSDQKSGVTPQLRVNSETNFWEVSYDEGATWVSMEVKATGEKGKDGVDGKDGKDGAAGKDGNDGINGKDGKDGVNGKDGAAGKDGTNGKDGINGINGTNGTNGTNGSNGVTPTIGEDGYWYIGNENTGIYAGTTETVKVTFKGLGGDNTVTVTKGSLVNYYAPTHTVADFINWYADEACKVAFNFNTPITADTTIYSKWEFNEQYKTVAALTDSVNFGRANCLGTNNCFGSVYVRVLADDHGYYSGAAGIANYLKGVFVENGGVVSVAASSGLKNASYRCDSLTIINFASAFSSYEQYILRNGMDMPSDIAAQKALAIRYFETVDNTTEGYNTPVNAGGYTFPSMGHAVVALGSLMEQQDTERFDALIKAAYDNYNSAYWDQSGYNQAFYQLCAHYDWYDMSALKAEIAALTSLTDANVLKYYGYGIDLAGEYSELWNAYAENALSDNALSTSEAKAFAYHYAYQLTGGEVWLGVYGSSHNIVDYNK